MHIFIQFIGWLSFTFRPAFSASYINFIYLFTKYIIPTDYILTNTNQKVDLTEKSWRKRSLDSDKSCRLRKIRTTEYNYSPVESPDLLAGIFHLLQTTRCSIGLNGSDPEQIEDRGWRLSLYAVDIWNTRLWQFTCVPARKINIKWIKATRIWSTNLC